MSRIRQRKQRVKHFREPKEGDKFLNAVALGEEKEVEDYLERGGSPHWTDCRGQTAMHVAAQYKQNKILEMLLPFFDDEQLNQRDMYGRAAWKVAYFFSNGRGMDLLENRPVNVLNPRMYKSYSFKQKGNITKKASKKMKVINETNPMLDWNMPQKKSSVIRSPIVYRSANRKAVFIADKRAKGAQKAQVAPAINAVNAITSPTTKRIHIANKTRFLKKHLSIARRANRSTPLSAQKENKTRAKKVTVHREL